jgi:hypothetical protein
MMRRRTFELVGAARDVRTCSACGGLLTENLTDCPWCGAKAARTPVLAIGLLISFSVIAIGWLLVWLYLTFMPEDYIPSDSAEPLPICQKVHATEHRQRHDLRRWAAQHGQDDPHAIALEVAAAKTVLRVDGGCYNQPAVNRARRLLARYSPDG